MLENSPKGGQEIQLYTDASGSFWLRNMVGYRMAGTAMATRAGGLVSSMEGTATDSTGFHGVGLPVEGEEDCSIS